MTALNYATEQPSAIALVEQGILKDALLLEELYRGKTYKEAASNAVDAGLAPLIDISWVTAADGTKRAIIRAAIEVNPSFATDTSQKLWMFAQPLGDSAVPAAFKSDS